MTQLRERMVAQQIAGRGITDARVLAAMRAVPREAFVPDALREFAYEDSPLPIEADQTISQPLIVAQMIELAALGPESVVLEVGAGSGYAAAVMGRIAKRVHAIEWHDILARTAAERMAALGYDNVEIVQGDGTLGWPEKAPFDAILVAAGGPAVPDTLRRQLKIGGRLIIPVASDGYQILTLVRRTGPDTFAEENHGAVMFVPLVGEHGWRNGGPKTRTRDPATRSTRRDAMPVRSAATLLHARRKAPAIVTGAALSRLIGDCAETFGGFDELARLVDRYADRRVVLLGEATHGTAEFYRARAWMTERLVALHGFNVVAVEADWPDAAAYDAYVRGRPVPDLTEPPFHRFPRWMWRNGQVRDLLERLRAANANIADPERQAGFYGLDIYSLGTSIDAVLAYLDKVDPRAAHVARERYACLTPWRADPATYGRMALSGRFEGCEEAVAKILMDLLERRLDYLRRDGEAFFGAEQNARIVARAEAYYRAMYYGAAQSWNLRDTHMFDTLAGVLAHRGPDAKAVVWAHNSHIGDAAATDMGRVRGEHNIGQLCRRRYGAAAALIGFGTDRGTVAAASNWDSPMEIMQVRPARSDSWEGHCRGTEIPAFLLDLGIEGRAGRKPELAQPLLQRAIGVVYRPESELMSHYFEAELARQFDAWVWFDETRAVDATPAAHADRPRDTFPFGL
ncbi:MAG: protein-L-isoaspartate(D-aspartate) O-methyltransferase [Alphaproteobacteria bacterium]